MSNSEHMQQWFQPIIDENDARQHVIEAGHKIHMDLGAHVLVLASKKEGYMALEQEKLDQVTEWLGKYGENTFKDDFAKEEEFETVASLNRARLALKWARDPIDGAVHHDTVRTYNHLEKDAAKLTILQQSLWGGRTEVTPSGEVVPEKPQALLFINTLARPVHPASESKQVLKVECLPRCVPRDVLSFFSVKNGHGVPTQTISEKNSDLDALVALETLPFAPEGHDKAFLASDLNLFAYDEFKIFQAVNGNFFDETNNRSLHLRLAGIFSNDVSHQPAVEDVDAPHSVLVGENAIAEFATELVDYASTKPNHNPTAIQRLAHRYIDDIRDGKFVIEYGAYPQLEGNPSERRVIIDPNEIIVTFMAYTFMALGESAKGVIRQQHRKMGENSYNDPTELSTLKEELEKKYKRKVDGDLHIIRGIASSANYKSGRRGREAFKNRFINEIGEMALRSMRSVQFLTDVVGKTYPDLPDFTSVANHLFLSDFDMLGPDIANKFVSYRRMYESAVKASQLRYQS